MRVLRAALALAMVGYVAASGASEECSSCEATAQEGSIADCCCDANTVQDANREHFLPVLHDLAKQPYFRFFKADLWRTCPFWPDDGQCMRESCAVCECEDEDMPASYAAELVEARQAGAKAEECHSAAEQVNPYDAFSDVIRPSKHAAGSAFEPWEVAGGDVERNVWTVQDEDSPTIAYVDLLENPEGFTGYAGPNAARIWSAIYTENCFPITGGAAVEGMCPEQRVFFRLISGLQTSINTHIALTVEDGGPSRDFWMERVGKWPERKENLYFAYLVMLRAAAKAAPILRGLSFDTGNGVADGTTKDLVQALLEAPVPRVFSAFDESGLFQVSREEVMAACPAVVQDLGDLTALQEQYMQHAAAKQALREEMRGAFRNVSRIMDCVGCDKCRLWGKIQFLGLGTAMKLLFAEHDQVIEHAVPGVGGSAGEVEGEPAFALSRNEVVALVNTLHRVAISVQAAQDFSAPVPVPASVPDPTPAACGEAVVERGVTLLDVLRLHPAWAAGAALLLMALCFLRK